MKRYGIDIGQIVCLTVLIAIVIFLYGLGWGTSVLGWYILMRMEFVRRRLQREIEYFHLRDELFRKYKNE